MSKEEVHMEYFEQHSLKLAEYGWVILKQPVCKATSGFWEALSKHGWLALKENTNYRICFPQKEAYSQTMALRDTKPPCCHHQEQRWELPRATSLPREKQVDRGKRHLFLTLTLKAPFEHFAPPATQVDWCQEGRCGHWTVSPLCGYWTVSTQWLLESRKLVPGNKKIGAGR